MDLRSAELRLCELWAEIRDLQGAGELLSWDQETHMPSGGVAARAAMASTLAGLRHRCLTAPELLEALEACEAAAPEGSIAAAQARVARFDIDRSIHVPESLAREIAEARSTGLAAWQEARARADFSIFQPQLERLVELRRQLAAAIDSSARPYDVLLQEFEPDATEAQLEPLFEELAGELGPLVREVVESGQAVDESPARGSFGTADQMAFSRQLVQAIGFDFDRGRLDTSTHPFCVGIDRTDVRMTWRCHTDDFRSAVFGALHEAGHGLYEQGLPAEWSRTPLGAAVSLGIHESQSRLWENHVGRSRGFWQWALPGYREAFPAAPEATVEQIWPLLHTVKPSFIRVEADEATYNLHILIRFELERRLFAGDVRVSELPEAWDSLYEKTLGIRPPSADLGVLQDIHWSQGMFGYFPTYTLGTMAAAQLFEAAERQLGPLEPAFARGEFAPLLDWLRENIHQHGGRYEAADLIHRATGEPLSSRALLTYLRSTVEDVYGVAASA